MVESSWVIAITRRIRRSYIYRGRTKSPLRCFFSGTNQWGWRAGGGRLMSRKSSTRSDSAISTSSPTAASYCDNAIMRIRDLHISESAAQESINNSGRSAQRERRGFLVRRVTRMEDLRRIQRFPFSLPSILFPPSSDSFSSLSHFFFSFFLGNLLSHFVFRHKCMATRNGNWLNTSRRSSRGRRRKKPVQQFC